LSAALGLPLHLVQPLGFSLDERSVKRAGLDYWPQVNLRVHADWVAAAEALAALSARSLGARLRLFTARGGQSLFATDFEADDILVFGSESRGLPAQLLERYPAQRVYIPIRSGVRSLNLANVVCLATYTALWRAGVALPDNDGSYSAHPEAGADIWPSSRVVDPTRSPG
jgi:tRNA (cytidine/uridine-2'-O-)-methyltransferase